VQHCFTVRGRHTHMNRSHVIATRNQE